MSRKNVDMPKPLAVTALHAIKSYTQAAGFAQFTDSLGTTGTLNLGLTIPKGSVVLGCAVKVPEGFASGGGATLQIGDGTDVDRYNTGTPSVASDAPNGVDVGIPSGNAVQIADKTVKLTITAGTAYGDIDAGQLIVTVFYI